MTRYLFFAVIVLAGCFSEKHNLKSNVHYDKIILAEAVSFFGKTRYRPAVNSRNNIQLLYRNDTLKYITSGHKRLNKYSQVENITVISDTLTLLTSQSNGVHNVTDTIIIMADAYHSKRIDHCGEHPSRIYYTTYKFTRKHLIRKNESLFPGDPLFAETFQEYIQRPLKRKPDTLYKYENVEEEKLMFLSRVIYHLK